MIGLEVSVLPGLWRANPGSSSGRLCWFAALGAAAMVAAPVHASDPAAAATVTSAPTAATPTGLPAAGTPVAVAPLAPDLAQCRPALPSVVLQSPLARWAISPCFGGVASVQLLDPQFSLPARKAPDAAPDWARAKYAAGPLDLVDSWDARWDPFRDFFGQVQVPGAVTDRASGALLQPDLASYAKFDPRWGVVTATPSSVSLVWPDPARVSSPLYLQKTYRLGPSDQPYALQLQVVAWHVGPGMANLAIVHDITAYQSPTADSGGLLGMFSAPPDLKGAGLQIGEEALHLDARALASADAPDRSRIGVPGWLGVETRYFMLAAAPVQGFAAQNDAKLQATPSGMVVARLGLAPVTLGPGDAGCAPVWLHQAGREVCADATKVAHAKVWDWQLYSGPKDLNQLTPFGHNLVKGLDFGWFGAIALPMLAVLHWGHSVTGSWPIAILLLTVLVKALLWPITMRSMKSMKAMGKLKPELEKLKADIEARAQKLGKKADPNEINTATFALYKQHGVNPVGGCLPLVLQMPVYIALYRSINASVSLYNQPLFFWISDMTQKDPYYILPLVLGAVMFVQQKVTPQAGGDPAQQKMMLYFMPGLFTLMMLALPSGLTLYILINTVLSVAQTMAMQRGDAPKALPAT